MQILKDLYEIETVIQQPVAEQEETASGGNSDERNLDPPDAAVSDNAGTPNKPTASGSRQAGTSDKGRGKQPVSGSRPTSKASAKSAKSAKSTTNLGRSSTLDAGEGGDADESEEQRVHIQCTKRFLGLEVVFVSSDRTESEMLEYMQGQHGRWLALKYADREGKNRLAERYQVAGLPTLVVVDRETGTVLSRNGRADVMACFTKPGDPIDVRAYEEIFANWHNLAGRGS